MTRRPNDFYETPAWCVRAYFRGIFNGWKPEEMESPGSRWKKFYEPFAGNGSIISAIPEIPIEHWTACDIDPSRSAALTSIGVEHVIGDAFDRIEYCQDKWIISNPPYSADWGKLSAMIDAALGAFLLLPLSFLGSAERNEYLRDNTPSIYVLPNRPSFTGDGRSYPTEYAWFRWSYFRRECRDPTVTILPVTPAEERRAK